jgi:5-methylcytosine-specific restriction endonuclease McrA
MSMTVVLSRSMMPLGVIPVRRAVVLLVLGKARAHDTHPSRRFRAERTAVAHPRTVVLNHDVRVPARMYRPAALSNEALFERDGWQCAYCGRGIGELRRRGIRLTRDHVVPVSRGGTDSWRNVVAACEPCNNAKGSRTPEEADLTLRFTPRTPTAWELHEKRQLRKLDE